MHRVRQVISVAVFIVAVHAFVIGNAHENTMGCKTLTRIVLMKSCKTPVSKREVDNTEIGDLADNDGQIKINSTELYEEEKEDEDQQHGAQQKRQWGYGYGNARPMPGMGLEMANNYHNTELQTPLFDFQDNQGSEIIQEQFAPNGFLPMPYGSLGMYPFPRNTLNSGTIELSLEDIEEIHREMRETNNNNSVDIKKIREIADICCPDENLCLKNPSLIKCML